MTAGARLNGGWALDHLSAPHHPLGLFHEGKPQPQLAQAVVILGFLSFCFPTNRFPGAQSVLNILLSDWLGQEVQELSWGWSGVALCRVPLV